MDTLSKMINKFSTNYPRVAEKVSNLNQSYPMELKLKMVVNLSVLMCKLEKGVYDKYMKEKGKKIPNYAIEMLALSYIKHYVLLADKVYES